jgi:hypothetical protein
LTAVENLPAHKKKASRQIFLPEKVGYVVANAIQVSTSGPVSLQNSSASNFRAGCAWTDFLRSRDDIQQLESGNFGHL